MCGALSVVFGLCFLVVIKAGPLLRLAEKKYGSLLQPVVDNVIKAIRDAGDERMDAVAVAVAETLSGMLGKVSKENPLSDDLASIKSFLDGYVQTLVQHGDPDLVDERVLEHLQRMFMQPAVTLIRGTIHRKLEVVRAAPQFYNALVQELGEDDCRIYSSIFNKEIKKASPAHQKMLQRVAELYAQEPFAAKLQPTANALELSTLMKTANPAFVALVRELTTNIDGVSVSFRTRLKSFYRMIEKAQLKVCKLDFTRPLVYDSIQDIAGCLIVCSTFSTMAATMERLYHLHQSQQHDFTIRRFKNTWDVATVANDGWRKFLVNVEVHGAICEVQVALKSMVMARTELDGHDAYNKFRCFKELLACLDV